MSLSATAAPFPERCSVRGRYMQTFAAHVNRQPPEDRLAIRAAVPVLTWASIEASGLLGWLPLSVNLDCTRAVAAQLGRERTHEFFRTLLLSTVETPLLRGLVQSVLRVAVKDPGLYLPWIGKGFGHLFREVGHFVVVYRWQGVAVMEIRSLPADCVADVAWAESVASALCALFELVGVAGSVKVREVNAVSRCIALEGNWTLP